MMKECFLFTCYDDTDIKCNISLNNIRKLIDIGVDICVYSHYPIQPELQSLSNFSIYDSDNPIIPMDLKSVIFWNKVYDIEINYHMEVLDYAVITQWVKGVQFLSKMGYDLVHVITYDITLDRDTFTEYKRITDDKSTFLKCIDKYPITTQLFTLNADGMGVISNITYDDYINSSHVFGEHFLNEYISDNHYDKFNLIEYDNWNHIEDKLLENEISMMDDGIFSKFTTNGVNCVIGNYNDNIAVFVYNVTTETNINLNGSVYYVNETGYTFIETNFPFSYDNITKLNLIINNNIVDISEQIDSYKMIKFKKIK
jgi:hypothetical protein